MSLPTARDLLLQGVLLGGAQAHALGYAVLTVLSVHGKFPGPPWFWLSLFLVCLALFFRAFRQVAKLRHELERWRFYNEDPRFLYKDELL